MNRFKINEKGYWETDNSVGHITDNGLLIGIYNLFNDKNINSVVDFGCGMGEYAKFFKEKGKIVSAFDGNPNTFELTKGIGKVLDLSNPFKLDELYDCVLSLEVGEHIPKEYEHIYIDNICKHSKKYVLVSWAIVGQGGDGHVNCQNNDYIINELNKRGYSYNDVISNQLRMTVTEATWFRDTIMFFEK
jgi:cyclopropane fatty-acyl-phospholipid synthase-like methyltransferase